MTTGPVLARRRRNAERCRVGRGSDPVGRSTPSRLGPGTAAGLRAMAIGPRVALTAPLRVAPEAGRVGRDPVLARLARAADLVGPANSGRPVPERTAGAGTALAGTAAPGIAGARNTAVAAAGGHRHETAHQADPCLGEVCRPAIRRVARGPAAMVLPATPAGRVARGPAAMVLPATRAGQVARDRAAVVRPANPGSPVAPGRPAPDRPAARVGVAGSGRSSGRAADRFAAADRHPRHPASWANPVGHVAAWVIQGPAHPGPSGGPGVTIV